MGKMFGWLWVIVNETEFLWNVLRVKDYLFLTSLATYFYNDYHFSEKVKI